MERKKVILIIMDGWGLAENPEVSAPDAAKTPFYDEIRQKYSYTTLRASEEWVGLPKGQMGNSEVGHMNIGAGRVVYQELVRISNALATNSLAENEQYRKLIAYCKAQNKPLHLMGLLSDGGVHSHIDHLNGIIDLLSKEKNLPPVYLHLFTDGRDTDPHNGLNYINDLETHLAKAGCGKIASVIGRYYAMDRNHQWGRIRKAYDLLTNGIGHAFDSAAAAVRDAYDSGITDEFIKPCVIIENGKPVATIEEADATLFFNFRTDRGRQLTMALTQKDMREYNMHTLDLYYCTLTRYDERFEKVNVLFDATDVTNGLGETLSHFGKKQIRIAETEKYAHVTFFFNGGREEPFEGEKRILCESPKVATYDLQPEMSAFEVRDSIIPEIEKGEADFICLNFANPDMVGHTGNFNAAVEACETVDQTTSEVANAALQNGYSVLITADHGNCDKMINDDGSPNTAHTTSLVPLILMEPDGTDRKQLKPGKLGDLAPTILFLMDLEIPEEMDGEILIVS